MDLRVDASGRTPTGGQGQSLLGTEPLVGYIGRGPFPRAAASWGGWPWDAVQLDTAEPTALSQCLRRPGQAAPGLPRWKRNGGLPSGLQGTVRRWQEALAGRLRSGASPSIPLGSGANRKSRSPQPRHILLKEWNGSPSRAGAAAGYWRGAWSVPSGPAGEDALGGSADSSSGLESPPCPPWLSLDDRSTPGTLSPLASSPPVLPYTNLIMLLRMA